MRKLLVWFAAFIAGCGTTIAAIDGPTPFGGVRLDLTCMVEGIRELQPRLLVLATIDLPFSLLADTYMVLYWMMHRVGMW